MNALSLLTELNGQYFPINGVNLRCFQNVCHISRVRTIVEKSDSRYFRSEQSADAIVTDAIVLMCYILSGKTAKV